MHSSAKLWRDATISLRELMADQNFGRRIGKTGSYQDDDALLPEEYRGKSAPPSDNLDHVGSDRWDPKAALGRSLSSSRHAFF